MPDNKLRTGLPGREGQLASIVRGDDRDQGRRPPQTLTDIGTAECLAVRQSASLIHTNPAKRKKMMPPTIRNPAHENGDPTRKLMITPATSSSTPNPTHNQVANRRREVGLGVDPAPVAVI